MFIILNGHLYLMGEIIMSTKYAQKTGKRKNYVLTKEDQEYRIKVGIILKQKMIALGKKNRDIANLLQCTEAHVISLKKGNSTMNILEALRLCDYFQMNPNELLSQEYIIDVSPGITENTDQKNIQKLRVKIESLTALQRQVLVSILSFTD